MDDLRQLRYLVALGDNSTLGEAAESLGVTKSALSQSLQRIEDIYGVPLFSRGRRGIKITVYGEMLVEAARQSMEIFINTRRQLELVQNLETGRIVIGCDPVVSEVLLSRALVRALHFSPKLKYVLKTGFWPDMQKALVSGEIDFFIGIRPDDAINEFVVVDIALPGILLYCRQGHPLLERDEMTLDDVFGYPIIGPLMPEWFYSEIDRQQEAADGCLSPRGELFFVLTNDEGTIREIVRQSDAISGGFAPMIQSDLEAARLAVLPVRTSPFGTPVPCIIVSHHGRVLSPAASAIVRTVKEVAAELVRDACEIGYPMPPRRCELPRSLVG